MRCSFATLVPALVWYVLISSDHPPSFPLFLPPPVFNYIRRIPNDEAFIRLRVMPTSRWRVWHVGKWLRHRPYNWVVPIPLPAKGKCRCLCTAIIGCWHVQQTCGILVSPSLREPGSQGSQGPGILGRGRDRGWLHVDILFHAMPA